MNVANMQTAEQVVLNISKRKLTSIIKDPVKTAQAVNLIYVANTDPGIIRVRKGKTFEFILENKKVKDKDTLQRIKSLVIPPAWEEVWICKLGNGHLQTTGLDVKKRKQYRYHQLWNVLRNQTKFYRLLEFGKVLPAMRLQLETDISLPGLPLEKVLATVVSLMERTNIRVGNCFYEKLYGSFGLTTFKDKHVSINGQQIRFSFKGKKGVCHDINIKSKRLASIVQKCKDIPGKELFQYINDNGDNKSIDSGMVNDYIKRISGSDFTAKDFRTWAGTVQALLAFKELGVSETQTESKRKIVEALDTVAKLLGNTRTVCKKYYVHPVVISLYEDQSLKKYITELNSIENDDNKSDLTMEEKVLMRILARQ
ncbi:MAG: DNA topoisomerase IB [Chitinophagaceae bacterium]